MPRLSMCFLGSYQVHLDGELVTTLAYDKVRALLAYLAVEADRPHRREVLSSLLWPELDDRRARHNLSQALLTLRRALDEEEQTPFVVANSQTVQFNAASDHWLDVSTFTSLLTACKTHPHWLLETCSICGRHLAQASALYGGPFLEGLGLGESAAFEEWQLLWRERLHHEATDTLRALACGCDHQRQYDMALRYATRWVALDPWDEGAHHQLMRALALRGHRSEALAQYESCRQMLHKELDVDPARKTTALYRVIRDQEPLPDLFPPLSNNLPTPTTSFVGREDLLDKVVRSLQDRATRLLTLVGPGGSGKTRLALRAGKDIVTGSQRDRFSDGVYFVDLRSLSTADGIAPTIAQTLDIGLTPGQDPKRGLIGALQRKRLLLILDNYEPLLGKSRAGQLSGTETLSDILRAAPGVRILVTSRVRLNLLAERTLPVSGMSFPSTHRQTDEQTIHHSAVRLFLESARAVQPTFAPAAKELEQVVRICRLVGGMPLAIVLAASWMDVLSPAEIADRVAVNLDMLSADLNDLPARQRSMRAVFDTSWTALTVQAQAAFARISVFCGGFTEPAATAVAGASLCLLRELVRASFLSRTETGRFEIHELLRRYGARQLDKLPIDQEETLDRHCSYYATFYGQRALDVWKSGIGQVAPEIGNILAAWQRALECNRIAQIREFLGQSIGGLLQLYVTMGWFAQAGQTFTQAARVLKESDRSRENDIALAVALRCQAEFAAAVGCQEMRLPLIRESALILSRVGAMEELAISKICAARCLSEQNETECERLLLESLDIARAADYTFAIGWASHLLGTLAFPLRDDRNAVAYWSDALEAFRTIEHHRGTSWVLADLASLAYRQGEYVQAHELATESMTLCQEMGWSWRVLGRMLFLGQVALAQGESSEGCTYYEQARARAQDLGDDPSLVFALCGLGDVALADLALDRARSVYRQALEIAAVNPDPRTGWRVIACLAALAAHQGHLEQATSLIATVEKAATRPLPPMIDDRGFWLDLRQRADSLLTELQHRLSPVPFTAARDRGRSMTLRTTIDELRTELGK